MNGANPVILQYQSHVLRITMNLPEKGNLINAALISGINQGLDRSENDPDCRCVVIESSGGVFSLGMDFKEVLENKGLQTALSADFGVLLSRIRNFKRTVIAFIKGSVKAGGLGLAAVCDLVIASESSSFALTEAVFGLVPAMIFPFIAERIGNKKAKYLTLSARTIRADEAHRFGLADEVVSDDEADRKLKDQLKRILGCDPAVVPVLKEFADELNGKSEAEKREISKRLFSEILSNPEKEKAIRGFMDGDKLPWSVKYSEKKNEP